MTILSLVALALAPASLHPTLFLPGILVDSGGAYVYSGGALISKTKTDGTPVGEFGAYRVALLATKPVSAAAFVSTESYKYQSLAISLGNAPSFLADAKGDSLLTINLLSSFRRETDDYLAATRFDTGGTKAKTRCWLAKLPVDYLGTGLGARFEGNKIRSWALLSKRSGFGLTLVNPWRLTEYEAEVSGQSNVFHEKSHSDLMLPSHARVVNYWPETRQLIVECFGMVYKLDKGGRVVAAIERESRSDTEAEWLLSSETSAANGGREAWLPLAHSSNRKLWLVQSRSTGERSLLKFR